MLLIKLAVLTFMASVLSLTLKKTLPNYAFLVSSCAAVGIAAVVLTQFMPVLDWLQSLSGYTEGAFIGPVVKALGIAIVAQLAADLCRDAGLIAAAGSAELAGRLMILLEAMPLLKTLLESFFALLG